MTSTDADDRTAPKKGSLLNRIEERKARDSGSLKDSVQGQENLRPAPAPPTRPLPPSELPQPPVDEHSQPMPPESTGPAHDSPPGGTSGKPKSGGLLSRLSSSQGVPVGNAPEQPPPQETAPETIQGPEESPEFLGEFEGPFSPDSSQSVFDESLPVSLETEQMMAEEMDQAAAETSPIWPFSGEDEPVTFMDATPSASPTGDRVMGSKVDEAMERLREKMAKVAMEFAEGKINQAQFQAIYNRYQEQRIITEQLLARDPTTDAWQQVLTEGHTVFLRARFEARVTGYTLYDNRTGQAIVAHGDFGLSADQMAHLLRGFYRATAQAFGGGMRSTVIEDGRWVIFVSGRYATGIMVFTLQPSEGQLRLVSDLHEDFERANEPALVSGDFVPEALVYPQRFLLQEPRE